MEKLFSPLVALFLLIILLLFCSILKPCESLKLKLIPPNSPESPLYLGNVTLSKKIETLVNQSKARSHLLLHNPNPTPQHDFGSKIATSIIFAPDNVPLYTVALGIGTFIGDDRYMPYFLHMDTGSDLTWLQCDACIECFPQEYPLYPSNQSLSYVPLTWSHDELCYSWEQIQGDDSCYYHIGYSDNSQSFGQLAYETFTFFSDNSDIDKNTSIVGGLVFGCGLNQEGFPYGNNTQKPNSIAGRFGLGRGVHAIHQQLSPRGSENKFSYCLYDLIHETEEHLISYLHFGGDIPPIDYTYEGTQLISVKGNGYYYIKIIDIMVNDDPLLIPSSVFEIKPDGSGGTILDSSTAFSLLAKPAYDKLEAYLVGNFSANSKYQTKQHSQFKVCYFLDEPEGYGKLPRIIFVFEGGRLEIRPEQAFLVDQDEDEQSFFCLAIWPHDSNVTVIGAYQQVNHRFVYDTNISKLWFKEEDCGYDT